MLLLLTLSLLWQCATSHQSTSYDSGSLLAFRHPNPEFPRLAGNSFLSNEHNEWRRLRVVGLISAILRSTVSCMLLCVCSRRRSEDWKTQTSTRRPLADAAYALSKRFFCTRCRKEPFHGCFVAGLFLYDMHEMLSVEVAFRISTSAATTSCCLHGSSWAGGTSIG